MIKSLSLFLALMAPLLANASMYRITPMWYTASANHSQICDDVFGEVAEVADFSDFAHMNAGTIHNLMDTLEVPVSRYQHHFFIDYQHMQFEHGDVRKAFFFEYMPFQQIPAFFKEIDSHAGMVVGVTNKLGRVVCAMGTPEERRKLYGMTPEEEKSELSMASLHRRLKSWWQ